MSGGCETVVAGIRATLDLHPEWVVLQVDVANAFNTISRATIFRALRSAGPELQALIPFVRGFYALESPLLYSHQELTGEYTLISSAEGTRQGDPLGGPLFAMAHFTALRATAVAHPTCLFPSLSDDTHIIGPPADILAALSTLTSELALLGLRVQPQKCLGWSPSGLPSDFVLPPGFVCPSDGIRVLGSPVGTESFCSTFISDTLRQALAPAPWLPKLGDSQAAFGLLLRCLHPRASYLMRTFPPTSLFRQQLQGFDSTMEITFASLLGPGTSLSSDWISQQMRLPISRGGFGLTSTAELAPLAFLGAWAQSCPLLADRFLVELRPFLLSSLMAIEEGTLAFQIQLREARSSLPASVRAALPSFHEFLSIDVARLQADLSERMHTLSLTSILTEAPVTVRARILSCGGKGAGGWLQANPAISSFQMSSSEFATAIRLRLGLPHPLLAGTFPTCTCTDTTSDTHVLRCPMGGETFVVHDAIRDVVAQLLSGSMVQVRREVPLDFPGPPPRRLRVDLTMFRDGRRTLADVVVADPLRQDLVSQASSRIGVAASRAAATKEEKYAGRPASDAFLPLAVEVFGRLHPQFDGLLRQAARDILSRTGASLSVLTTHFRQRILVTLQRAQARAIHRRSLAVGGSTTHSRQTPLEELHIPLADLSSTLDVDL